MLKDASTRHVPGSVTQHTSNHLGLHFPCLLYLWDLVCIVKKKKTITSNYCYTQKSPCPYTPLTDNPNIKLRKLPCITAFTRINPGIKLTKRLYKENYKAQFSGRLHIVKIEVLPKTIYQCNILPIKIPMICTADREKSILKFIWKCKRPWISIKKSLKQSTQLEDSRFCISTFYYYKATIIKTPHYYHKGTHIDKRTRTEGLEVSPDYLWTPDFQ